MGYGHWIVLDRDFDREAMVAAIRDIRELIARTEIRVVGPAGKPKTLPILEPDRVIFNGVSRYCVLVGESIGAEDTNDLGRDLVSVLGVVSGVWAVSFTKR